MGAEDNTVTAGGAAATALPSCGSVRESARLLTENGIEVAARVGDAHALLRSVRDLSPDVALVDIRMPPTHTDEGLRAARDIRSCYPGTAVLVLSQHLEPNYAIQLVQGNPSDSAI